ncbi:MAG: aminoacyl-tRNA hydrolase, partial [Candidatus Nealsonbacteria bacterium]|nr:aminoacyl-tRNA hydrolase [Candidatus Nealsonbacteria bacterium]
MKIIIGLGNPGEKYENTWHNIGFMALDEIIRENNFSDFRFEKKFNAEISENSLNGEKIIIAKPQTYMNESGKTVRSIMDFYKLSADDFIIIHDDVDLPVSKIKIYFDRGSAGHKGVQSIFIQTGKENFIRIRMGISPQKGKDKKAMHTVLKEVKI